MPFAFTPQQMSDSRTRERVQPDDRAAAPGRDDRGNQRSDANDRREYVDRLPQSADFVKTSGFTGFARPIRQQLVGDTRVRAVRPAGRRVSRSAHRVLQRRESAADARHRTRTRAGDSDDARRRPRRLVRQMLTEGVVLSLLGAVAGLALGVAGVRALLAMSATQIPGQPTATLHLPVLAFTLLLGVVTGIVFGVVPAISVIRGNTNRCSRTTRHAGRRDAHRLLPRRARRRGSCYHSRPSRRRRPADQELCQPSARRPGISE